MRGMWATGAPCLMRYTKPTWSSSRARAKQHGNDMHVRQDGFSHTALTQVRSHPNFTTPRHPQH